MKNILITQSLYKDKNNTVYTRLDYDWYKYADKLKFNLLPIPFDNKMKFLSSKNIDGIIFSGGNDIYLKNKKEVNLKRDKFESKIYRQIIRKKIPKLFVCRGMQFLANIFNINTKLMIT